MATPPTERLPTWATGGGADIVDPGVPQQALGWVVDDKPPAGWLNWWKRTVGEWISYFDTWITENDALRMAALRTFIDIGGMQAAGIKALGEAKYSPILFGASEGGMIVAARSLADEPALIVSRVVGNSMSFQIATTPQGGTTSRAVAVPSANTAILIESGGQVYSLDTLTLVWTNKTALAGGSVHGADADPTGNVIVVARSTATIHRSADGGATWSAPVVPGSVTGLWRVRWLPAASLFFIGGSNGFLTSPDGVTWTDQTARVTGGTAYGYDDCVWCPVTSRFYLICRDSSDFVQIFAVASLTAGLAVNTKAGAVDADGGRYTAATDGAGRIIASSYLATYTTENGIAALDGSAWNDDRGYRLIAFDADANQMLWHEDSDRFVRCGWGIAMGNSSLAYGMIEATPVIW